MISQVSSVNCALGDVASDTEQQYAEKSEEEESDDEEDTEEGEEAELSSSETVPWEVRSKRNLDPSARATGAQAPSVLNPTAPVPSVRSSKYGRTETAEPTERLPKQPKQVASKPRKGVALPKIKVTVRVA